MDEYVKISDLENYVKCAEMINMPLDKDALELLKYAKERAVSGVLFVKCDNCPLDTRNT